MRKQLVVIVLAACASKEAAAPAADAIEYVADIDLATQPTTDWIDLPMSGRVHVEVHLQHAKPDLSHATGTIRLVCANGCQLGDDKTKIVPKSPRASAFAGEGIEFGHVTFDSIDIGIKLDSGLAEITTWNVTSKDVKLIVSGNVKLGRTIGESVVDLCLRFDGTPELLQRSPKTAAAIMTTGAPRSAKDGLFNIKLADRFDRMRRLGRVCDGSPEPAVAVAPPDSAAPLPPAPPPDQGIDPDTAAKIAAAIKQTSDTTFDVDAKLWSQLSADPTLITRSARLVPAIKDGHAVGFKVYAIRADSMFAHLGLLNGDTIVSVAGESLMTADKALEAYTKLHGIKRGDTVQVAIERRGKPATLTYTLK